MFPAAVAKNTKKRLICIDLYKKTSRSTNKMFRSTNKMYGSIKKIENLINEHRSIERIKKYLNT